MHQAVLRHVATPAAFQRCEIIRAPLHLQLFQLVRADALFLHFADHRIKRLQSRFVRILGLVENARGHLRRPVVTEDVVNSAAGISPKCFFASAMPSSAFTSPSTSNTALFGT